MDVALVDHPLRHVVFEVAVESLIFAIFYFQIPKITSAVLSG